MDAGAIMNLRVINGGKAAALTVEALALQLRKGPAALQEPSARRRISELNDESWWGKA
jgi:hypothetical protein